MYHIIDSVIVGHYIGKEALAAVGASFPIIFTLISLIIGIASGSTVIIAQYFGAKDINHVKRTIDTLFIFLLIASITVTIIGISLSKRIFILLALPPELIPQATTFLNIILVGLVAMFGYNGTSAILRGMGDSKTPLYFLIIATVMNILLDLLFILVFKWGVGGAALATVISQVFTFVAVIIYINKYHKIIRFSLFKLTFDWDIFLKSLKIGLPTGLQQTFVALGMLALTRIVNSFGTDVIAAYSVVGRIDSMASMPAMNFAMALSAFVGQNIGAQKSERVHRGLVVTLQMSSIIAVSMSLVAIFFGHSLMHMFTNDTNVIHIGQQYLAIVGSFYLAFNAMFIIGGVMRGAGDTLIPMFFSLFSLWIIRIPLAYFMSKHFGVVGIWWAIPVAWCIGVCTTTLYYRTGRWKKKAIIKQHVETIE